MTEDISKYVFDFETEAKALLRDLGTKAGTTMFAQAALFPPDSPETAAFTETGKFFKANLHIIGGEKIRDGETARFFLQHAVEGYARSGPYKSPVCTQVFQDENTAEADRLPVIDQIPFRLSSGEEETLHVIGHLVTMSKNNGLDGDMDRDEQYGEEYRNLAPLYALYHEFGHSLLEEGVALDEDKIRRDPSRESRADAFAAICLLQRFGREAAPFLSRVSWERSLHALAERRTEHLTSPVIDRIVADSAHRDFSGLSLQETIDLAWDYTDKWTPDPSVVSAARDFFFAARQRLADGLDATTKMQALAALCLTPEAPDFAAYVGGRVIRPLLEPEGVVYNGKPWRLADNVRGVYAGALEERTSGISLSALFNHGAKKKFLSSILGRKKEPRVSGLLKECSPSGSKPFAVNVEPYLV